MMNNFYALYRGDKFITVADTIQELAEFMHILVSSARWLSYPTAHKRFQNQDANLIYKYEV
jgi:hypothetical protein